MRLAQQTGERARATGNRTCQRRAAWRQEDPEPRLRNTRGWARVRHAAPRLQSTPSRVSRAQMACPPNALDHHAPCSKKVDGPTLGNHQRPTPDARLPGRTRNVLFHPPGARLKLSISSGKLTPTGPSANTFNLAMPRRGAPKATRVDIVQYQLLANRHGIRAILVARTLAEPICTTCLAGPGTPLTECETSRSESRSVLRPRGRAIGI